MEVSADMADMEQQIIDLAQEVDYMEAERDYWKELSLSRDDTLLSNSFERWQELSLPRDGQQVYTQAEVDIADAERKRSWEENKAFNRGLAERNAELRKQLGEKHDDNCRLQRSLAEEHNKLRDALYKGVRDSKEPEASTTLALKRRMDQFENGDISSLLEADLERLTSMVETLWAERYDS